MLRKVSAQSLQKRVAFWQERMRLKDWDIVGIFITAEQMDSPQRVSQADIEPANKTASLEILSFTDPFSATVERNLDEEIVHEMIHIHLCFLPVRSEISPYQIAMEQAVSSLAKAIVLGFQGKKKS